MESVTHPARNITERCEMPNTPTVNVTFFNVRTENMDRIKDAVLEIEGAVDVSFSWQEPVKADIREDDLS